MQHIEKNIIPQELYNMTVVIYGGGYTGKIIINLLHSRGVKIESIIDDNENIQGTYIENVEVISYKKFCECNADQKTALILTTIYGKTVLKRIEKLTNVQVYELYDWYSALIGKDDLLRRITQETEKIQEMKKQIDGLKGKWADEESGYVLEGLIHFLDTKDLNDIADICTEEEQYFIPEVLSAIHSPVSIIDGGAYRGELLQTLKNNNVNFEKWYCFEADAENYESLSGQAKKEGLNERQVCINKGLWSYSGRLFFESKGAEGKIVFYPTDQEINAVSIDDYFEGKHFNYIKMDIEGAELPALQGGMQLIKKERPILAISIYHSLEDFWKIPQYLMSELEDYRYYVRHHSLIFCETVLYAIPNNE